MDKGGPVAPAAPAVADFDDYDAITNLIDDFQSSVEDHIDNIVPGLAAVPKFCDEDKMRYDKFFVSGSTGSGAALSEPDSEPEPSMPRCDFGDDPHRVKTPSATFGLPAAVARPVGKKEIKDNQECLKAMMAEWSRLREKGVWIISSVREWSDVAAEARKRQEKDPNYRIHMGRLFG